MHLIGESISVSSNQFPKILLMQLTAIIFNISKEQTILFAIGIDFIYEAVL